jgi:diacylglycerol kinase family enzyme
LQIARAAARTATGDTHKSPFIRITKARKLSVKLDRKVRYELYGGDRKKVKKFKVKVEPGAVTVCVPATGGNGGK